MKTTDNKAALNVVLAETIKTLGYMQYCCSELLRFQARKGWEPDARFVANMAYISEQIKVQHDVLCNKAHAANLQSLKK